MIVSTLNTYPCICRCDGNISASNKTLLQNPAYAHLIAHPQKNPPYVCICTLDCPSSESHHLHHGTLSNHLTNHKTASQSHHKTTLASHLKERMQTPFPSQTHLESHLLPHTNSPLHPCLPSPNHHLILLNRLFVFLKTSLRPPDPSFVTKSMPKRPRSSRKQHYEFP